MSKSVLLLSLEPDSQAELRAALAENGCSVRVVGSEFKLLECLADQASTMLILIDIEHLEQDGFAMIKKVKSFKPYADIPVIFMMSKNNSEVNALHGLGGGIIDFVITPFNSHYLISKILGFIAAYQSHQALCYEVVQRKALEEKLHLSSALFEHSLDAVMVTNADQMIEAVNPAFVETTGY
ncbi:MAG: response regulator, partial [Mariprofundaceae bacterium]